MPGVFVLDGDNRLHELAERAPDTEDYLQQLLADFPRLIPGELIDPESPRKWLLVSRELKLGDSAESTGRWWNEHVKAAGVALLFATASALVVVGLLRWSPA